MSSSNTASILNSVLATLVSSYEEKPETVVVKARRTSTPRVKPAGTVRVVKAANGAVRKVSAPAIACDPPGTLSAAAFLLALREAGKIEKKNDSGVTVMIVDAAKEKIDQVKAIGAFVGYNFSGAHGTQLDTARQTAQFRLRPVKADSAVAVTVKAFVAGMPDGTAKIVRDLQARIRMATDLMLDHEKEAGKHAEDSAEYATHMALATVESERIAHMRRDLVQIVGE